MAARQRRVARLEAQLTGCYTGRMAQRARYHRPETHYPPDDYVHPVKVYDTDRQRLRVKHFVRGLKAGDFLTLTEDGAPRRYRVIGNTRVASVAGVWIAELMSEPGPVTILGQTYG